VVGAAVGIPRDLSGAGPEAAGETVTNDQLRLRLLRVEGRLAVLEAAQAARPARRKRPASPRPTDAVVAMRQRLWDRFTLLQVGHGPTTKLAFAVRYHLGHPSDLSRFLSSSDARGVPEGSATATRYYAALRGAIAELERTRGANGQHSHGNVTGFQSSSLRPQ
jgi:hypothetical protein